MIRSINGDYPSIDKKAWVAEGAAVIGRVKLGEYSSIWYNSTVRGDINKIEIGNTSNIQDNAVLHVSDKYPCVIKDFVTVGHGAILHGCTIEDHCLVGMASIVMDSCVIGRCSIIAAGAVVTKGTVAPPFSLLAGVPAKVIKTLAESNQNTAHALALKYKTLWTKLYHLLPNDGD